jgi:hypothetical protein
MVPLIDQQIVNFPQLLAGDIQDVSTANIFAPIGQR